MGGDRAKHAGMMENFSALFGGTEPPPPTTAAALGFGPGKPGGPGAGPPPVPTVTPVGEEVARKAAAANGPFYLMRELPGSDYWGRASWVPLANRSLEAGAAWLPNVA